MKRILLVIATLLTLAMGYANLQGILPASVNHFFYERSLEKNPSFSNSFHPTLAQPRIIAGVEMIDAFIEIENKSVLKTLENSGVIINCEFEDFVTAQIPVSRLTKVSELPGVINVEISKILELCTDSTLNVTHAYQVLNGSDYGLPQAYDGSGIIIGIIDGGFDYQHLAFRCADDTTRRRIVRVYDPVDTTGHPAFIGSTALPGSIFMGNQIDTLTTDLYGSHGTHTASIAAGMHVNGYGGMAPGADIVLCASKTLNSGIYETEIINCLKYIYAYADSVDKPCVISVSTSLYYGIHDGTDYLSRAIAQLVGPGRIFVISAGNCAGLFNGHGRYTHGPSTKTAPMNVELLQYKSDFQDDYTFFYRSMSFETWIRTPNVRPYFQFHILDKQSRQIVWTSEIKDLQDKIYTDAFSNYYRPNTATDSIGYMEAIMSYSVKPNKYGIRANLYNLRSTSYTVDSTGFHSRYSIGFTIYPGQRDSCYVDSWTTASSIYFCNDTLPVYVSEGDSLTRIDNFYSLPSDECSINTYAVNDSIISAGNYAARNSHYCYTRDSILIEPNVVVGDIYHNSSYQSQGSGPTGKMLPTVCAPGVTVIAAGSRYSYFSILNPVTNTHLVMIGPNRSLWGEMTGTSMSAPTVAGIIAQWLQVDPNLSPSDIKNIIAQTAIKDNFTSSPHFGPNGKIDAMAGIRYLLGLNDDDFVLGDANGDGRISIGDVTTMIDILLGIYEPVPELRIIDANQDGAFSIGDVTTLIDMLLGII
jgi:subtilisin family serine protease